MSEIKEMECGVTLTIENRLGHYAEEKNEERNAILWYVWQQNKRWLGNILDWILPSFPNYSTHDKSHAFSVLHNIEMLLGQQQIMKLSASDCFMILHVVFLHDIGMCITTSDRSKLMKNSKFIRFLLEGEEKGDEQTREYAKLLLKYCKELGIEEKTEDVLKVKLDVYYAMIFLVAEYVRKEHASNSRELLQTWLERSDKVGLGYGFSYSGIPRRLFYTVGACACIHNSPDFKDVMELPKIDDGFAHDYIHPRFIAVLLQLGDSLDLDNDRFHPLTREVMGKLPWESEIHYEKHNAIRRLRISPLKITVAADCSSPEVLRLINKECKNIKEILQNASYHWSAICPDDLDARLPNFEPVELKMNGKTISDRLISAEFNIQQKKAFNFLQGGNFYKDVKFVFLRELFQNAVDASKMQYWIDWTGGRWNNLNGENVITTSYSLSDMGKQLSPRAYPIEVEFHLAQREKNTGKIVLMDTKSDLSEIVAKKNEGEYGIHVCMIDYGIGMSEEDIYAIADVGTSYEKNEKRRKGMPSWLLPTAEFGIGLQSVFLISDSFMAYTHTRSGEKYKIEFKATGDKGNGHIHVMPLEEDERMQYGTRMEVFVPCTEKKKHQQELKTWCGRDPFSEDYVKGRPFRHARELAVQLAASLDDLVGERIFPIELRLYDYVDKEDQVEIYSQLLSGEIKNLNYKIFLNGHQEENSQKKLQKGEKQEEDHVENKQKSKNGEDDNENRKFVSLSLEAREEYVAWPFYQSENEEGIIRGQVDKIEYMFDCEHVKLYLYDHEHYDVYARFGADRLQDMWEQAKKNVPDGKESGTKIFYKGIYVECREWKKDANLLEYIDIKEKIERKYLKINRCEFTSEGQQYLEEQIYPHVLEIARKVLLHCKYQEVIEAIMKRLTELQTSGEISGKSKRELTKEEEARIYNIVLASAGLAVFAQIRNRDRWEGEEERAVAKKWNTLFKGITKLLDVGQSNWEAGAYFSMFQIEVLELKKGGQKETKEQSEKTEKQESEGWPEKTGKAENEETEQQGDIQLELSISEENIAEILDSDHKYAIVSVRKSKGRAWKEFLIRLNPNKEDSISAEEFNNKKELLPYIMNQYIQLEKKRSWEERKKLLIGIEKEGDRLLQVCHEFMTQNSEGKVKTTGKGDKIIKWILCNMPSTEVFFSEDSNLRINVMGLEYSDALYLNRYMRQGIWEKMEKIYQERKIERFSTIVPCGYSGLEIRDKEKSVYYVKRGFFLYMERPYVINPFTAKAMEIVSEYYKSVNPDQQDNCQKKSGISEIREEVEKELLEKINEECGFESNKQNDDNKRVMERLLDYVQEKGNKRMARDELVSLYKTYLQEWIHVLVWCT